MAFMMVSMAARLAFTFLSEDETGTRLPAKAAVVALVRADVSVPASFLSPSMTLFTLAEVIMLLELLIRSAANWSV